MTMIWRKISRKMRSKSVGIPVLMACFVLLLFYHSGSGDTSKKLNNKKIRRNSIPYDKDASVIGPEESEVKVLDDLVITNRNRNNSSHVNPYPFSFTMLPEPCTDEQLVIIVHSAVQYHKRRMLCRGTWLNDKHLELAFGMKTKIVFVTGASLYEDVTTYIHYEHEQYNDIIQSDFIDDYQNNTYKAISFLRWVSSSDGCPNASLVMKVDDDALIHEVRLPKLNKTLHQALETGNKDVYIGRLLTQEVNRNNQSKWYVSYDLWPHRLYPVWFQGLVYILTPHLAAKLYPIALDTKYMFTDDVYMGVLVSQVKEAHVIVENMIGAHTEGELSNWGTAFRIEGRMFYHVPNLTLFYKWYHLDNKVVRYDPSPQLPHKKHEGSGSSAGAVFILIIILIVPLTMFAVIACFLYSENPHGTNSQHGW